MTRSMSWRSNTMLGIVELHRLHLLELLSIKGASWRNVMRLPGLAFTAASAGKEKGPGRAGARRDQ
jgi:hypothetical protein